VPVFAEINDDDDGMNVVQWSYGPWPTAKIDVWSVWP